MGTVTISAIVYNVYGDQASATNYLAASLTKAAKSWQTASPTVQAQALVMCARMLDRQTWQGVVGAGPLQWPRSNVVNKFGVAVPPSTIPDDILNASYELAALLVNDPALQDQLNNTFNIQSFTTGPASVTYFKPNVAGRFPVVVQELIGQYLARSANMGGSIAPDASGATATDTTGQSQFVDGDRYGLTRGT